MQNIYESIIVSLSEHLCVSKALEIEEKAALLVAPFSTGGRMSKPTDHIIDVNDIRVLHGVMYLWIENDHWIIEYELGQTRPRNKFKDKSEAIKFIKSKVEEYWCRHLVSGC